MTVRLGTVAAIGFEDFPPAEWLDCFRQLGCEAVQAYRNQNANISVPQMRDAIAAGRMPCDSLHGVYGEEFDPSCPAEPNRRFAVDTFKSEGELALALGGSLVVVHCATIRRDGIDRQEHRLRIEQLAKSIVELGEFGQSIGVQYAFENLPNYHAIGYDVAELTALLAGVNAPNTGLCFDTGHAHMTGDAVEKLRQAAGSLIYVHFSDNNGESDDHDMVGCGTLDAEGVARAVREIDYRGTLMLECFYDVEKLKRLIDEGFAERLSRIVRLANGQDA